MEKWIPRVFLCTPFIYSHLQHAMWKRVQLTQAMDSTKNQW